MIEQLEGIDRSLVLAINSIHSSWLDEFMWLVSGKLICCFFCSLKNQTFG